MSKTIAILLLSALAACAGKTEETIVELCENGRFSEAQAEANRTGLKGEDAVRVAGILFHGAGLADSAQVYLKKAMERSPKDPRIVLRLAEVMVWKKSLAPARDMVAMVSVKDAAATIRPWEALMRRATIHLNLQDLAKAREGFLAVATDPKTPASWGIAARLQLAQIAAWTKEFQQSIAMSDSILKGAPGHVQASLLKGQVQEWQGKYDLARATYVEALQKHPDEWQLRQRLEKLSWVK